MTRQIAPSGGKDDQIRRTARILEMVQQIAAAPGYWSPNNLSEHHEVSKRMIGKDLELIRYRLGLKLDFDGTGYVFERLPQLPTTTYSFGEALSLLTASRVAQSLPGVNSADLAAAIARLEAIFPDELRPLLREATEQLPRRAVKAHRQTMLALLHRALVEKHQIQIAYATGSRGGQVNARVVEPYHLLPYGRSWHLIAYDHKREDVLQFKVDRIQEAELLESHYNAPKAFDLETYLGDGWGMMRGSAGPPEQVILHFEAQAGRWVAEEEWHKSQQSEELPDGRIQVEFLVGITPEMVSWLLYYGEKVVVVRPRWLGEKVFSRHQQAMLKQERVNA